MPAFFEVEVERLAARNLTREQVVADCNTIKAVLGSWREVAEKLGVPQGSLTAAVGGNQAFTNGILFALYSDPPGNEIRVVGPNRRYIARGDVAVGDAESTDDWKPTDGGDFAEAQAGEAEAHRQPLDTPVVAEQAQAAEDSAASAEQRNVEEARAWIREGGARKAEQLAAAEASDNSARAAMFVATGDFIDPLAIARDALIEQRNAIAAQLAAVQPLIAAKARIEAAIAALEVAGD